MHRERRKKNQNTHMIEITKVNYKAYKKGLKSVIADAKNNAWNELIKIINNDIRFSLEGRLVSQEYSKQSDINVKSLNNDFVKGYKAHKKGIRIIVDDRNNGWDEIIKFIMNEEIGFSLKGHPVSQEYSKQSDINVKLENLNNDFADVSYVYGWCPTSKDTELFDTLRVVLNDELTRWPHLNRWYINMKSFTQEERLAFPAVETPLTSLARRVDKLKCARYINKDMLDKKVRQLIVCKQSCHKLLRNCCGEHAEKDSPS